LSDEVRLANEELRAWRQRHSEKVEQRVRLLRGTVESLAPVPDRP
jgi:tryptophan 2,3-dioxygenase